MALAVERDRPLPPADDLAHVRGDRAVVHQEAALRRDLDARAAVVDRHLVSHQRSVSSRADRAQGWSTGATRWCSERARVANTAARAAAEAAPSESSSRARRSHWATKLVS